MRIINACNLKGSPLALNVFHREVLHLAYYYWGVKIQNYTTINDIYGAIACALLEFRARVRPRSFGFQGVVRKAIARELSKVVDQFYVDVAYPYEKIKCKENGDVYEAV
jgi:hypothetical protein